MLERAYTHVSRGHARVGNRWIERTWMAFVGQSTSLLQRRGEQAFEWLEPPCAEFRIEVEDATFGVMDLGDIEWNEDCSAIGATLTSRKRAPNLEIVTKTTACHEAPGLWRSIEIGNTGDQIFRIARIVAETLRLCTPGLQFAIENVARTVGATVWRADDPSNIAALILPKGGLVLDVEGPAVFDLFAPERGVCAVAIEGPRELAPGEFWRLPTIGLTPFFGDAHAALSTAYAEVLSLRRAMAAKHTAESP